MFGTAHDYHELNAGAHRNIPKKLRAPALVWHLAFWHWAHQGADQLPREGEGRTAAREIKHRIDHLILTLCLLLRKRVDDGTTVDLFPCIANAVVLFSQIVHPTSLLPVDEDDLLPRHHDVLASSSRAVSIKFRWMDIDFTIRCEIHTEYFTLTSFAEFNKDSGAPPYTRLKCLNHAIEQVVGYWRTGTGAVPAELNKYFFHEFWNARYAELLHDVQTFDDANLLRHVFADIRGWIISEEAVRFPFEQDRTVVQAKQARKWGIAAKEKLLPLIKRPDETQPTRSAYECTVSYLLAGRAAYMSTLGPQAVSATPDERIPVEFILYAHQRERDEQTNQPGKTIVNPWQLGRATNLILLLETLRLAALKDIKPLHEAGSELRELEQVAQKARDQIADPSGGSDAENTIREAHKRLNAITGQFIDQTGSGLLYRIERSRYYVDQFRLNVKLLRGKRVEGDQPYGQFVERRVGAEFDFVDRLGTRYQRATTNIALLDQNYLAMRTNDLQQGIHNIQRWGEFALLGVLVPYYVTHLLELFLAENLIPIVAVVVWMCAIAFAIMRILEMSIVKMTGIVAIFIGLFGLFFSHSGTTRLDKYSEFFRAPGGQLELLKEASTVQQRTEDMQRETLALQREQLRAQQEQVHSQQELLSTQLRLEQLQQGQRRMEKDRPDAQSRSRR